MISTIPARVMKHGELFEIRLESIGGLGANLAGKMLGEAGVLQMGLNGSNSSSYGSEKKGSPVTTFIRFAHPDDEIRTVAPIEQPVILAVFHESLLHHQGAVHGLLDDGVLIVNTEKSPEEIRAMTGFRTGTVVCVNALAISLEEKTRINTAMLGAISRMADVLSTEAVMDVIRETFSKKYPALVAANLRTFERGYEEVRVDIAALSAERERKPFVRAQSQIGYASAAIGGVIVNPGNSIAKDLSTSRQGYLPDLKLESCIHCAACDQVCPDFCFVWENRTDDKGRAFQFLSGIDYQYCKGCLKCIEACPTDALSRVRETDGYADEHRVKHAFV